MKHKSDGLFGAGVFSALLFVLDLCVNLGDWTEVLWFCPVAAALLAIAFFRRDSWLMTLCLVLAIPAQSPWVWDFLLFFIGGGMGRTANLAQCGVPIFWGSIIVHAAVSPLAVWGVFKLGYHQKVLLPALIFGNALLIVSYLFTPEYKNVNCVFYSCDGDSYGMDPFTYFLVGCLLRWELIVPASFFTLQWLFRNHLYNGERVDANDTKIA